MSLVPVTVYSPFTTSEITFLSGLAGLAYVTGDILYYNGTNLTRLGIGTAGQALVVNAGASAPEWATPAGGGDVVKVGTPVNNQLGVWTGNGTLEGDPNLTWDGAGTLFLESEATGATGVIINTNHNTATPAVSDVIFKLQIDGEDSAGNTQNYANITAVSTNVTSTTEAAKFVFSVATAGTVADELELTGTSLYPTTNDGLALGTTSLGWADIFLATGAVINVANGDAVITHSAGIFTVSTGDLRVTTAGTNAASVVTVGGTQTLTSKTLTSPIINTGTIGTSLVPTSNDGASLGNTTNQFSDLFLAEGGVINWDNGDVTMTQTGNVLAFAGASSGYTYDAGNVIGHTAQLATGAITPNLQIHGTTADTASMVQAMFNATAGTQAEMQFYRSKNAAIGSATVVASGDGLGKITWYGAQQTGTFATQTAAAQIRAEVDGTVTSGASGDMPGRLIFATTADGGSAVTDRLILDAAGILKPNANDGVALGTATLSFADLFLASGAVVNFNNGDVLITHSANTLTFSGASSGYLYDAVNAPSSNDAAALGTTTLMWSDLFLASGAVINFNNGDVTITHSSNVLAFAGASTNYTFDAAVAPATNDGAALGTTSLGWADLYLATGGNILVNNANAKRTLILSGAGGAPTTTIGCGGPTKVEAGTNDIDYYALEFDTTTEERAFWNVQMPDAYDGGTVTARFIWTNAGGSAAQTVDWGIKARAYADDDAIDQAYGTEITTTDTYLAQGDIHISAVSSAITIGGSPAGGRFVVFNVGRKVATDNLSGDARLLAVQIEYGINAYSD